MQLRFAEFLNRVNKYMYSNKRPAFWFAVLLFLIALVSASVLFQGTRHLDKSAQSIQLPTMKIYGGEINLAELAYARANPNLGFACEMQPLVSAHLIDPQIARFYRVTFIRCKKTPAGMVTEYSWVASPEMPEPGKIQLYCGDQTGVIRVSQLNAVDCMQNGTPVY